MPAKVSPELNYRRPNSGLTTPWAILLGSILIAVSNLVGAGVLKLPLKYTPVAVASPVPVPSVTINNPAPVPTPQPLGPVKVGLGDDPILGSSNATVALIEFSDYECPFCKQYFDNVYSTLKTSYIDTGKVKEIYRNFPLSFHQNAHKEAEAALCIRDQGGDSLYYKYHDAMFTKTTSNGLGLALTQLPTLAESVGGDGTALQQCLDAGKYVSKVDSDISDGTKAGVNATPTFFLGKLGADTTLQSLSSAPSSDYPQNMTQLYDASHKLIGYKIEGSLPLAVFQKSIDTLLNTP